MLERTVNTVKIMKELWQKAKDIDINKLWQKIKGFSFKKLLVLLKKELFSRELRGYLRMDLYRAFFSVPFLLAVIAMALMLYISVRYQINEPGIDVAYLHMLSQAQAFNDVFYILAALPFAASFCLDWNHQFLKPLLIRANIVRYALSKIMTCALSGFAAIALGQTLFILILRLSVPLVNQDGPAFGIVSQFTHGALLQEGHNILYFVVHIVGMSLGAAFYAMMAFLVSTRIQNVFVVMASPMIMAFAFRVLTDTAFAWVPAWATPTCILIGRCNLATPLRSFFYEVFVFTLVSVLLGLLIIRQLKRRLGDG